MQQVITLGNVTKVYGVWKFRAQLKRYGSFLYLQERQAKRNAFSASLICNNFY